MCRNPSGSVLVLVVAAVVALLGLAALATDIAQVLVHKQRLQNAADLAALAGAQDLPEQPEGAVAAATAYLLENGVAEGEIGNINTSHQDREIHVRVHRRVSLRFARLLGLPEVEIRARAVAAAYPVDEVVGIVPWGHEAQAFAYGQEYQLKWGRPDPETGCCRGNYQIINISGTMDPQQYEEWVANDYTESPIRVGQRIPTRTGTLGNHTIQGLDLRRQRNPGADCTPPNPDPDCPMIVTVPVVRSFVDLNGVGEVEVRGFARFLVTRTEPDISGNVTVYGVYLTGDALVSASPQAQYYGLKNISLVR